MLNSITKRWVRGSLLFTLLILLTAEFVFVYFTYTGTYNDAERALQQRADTVIAQLNAYEPQTEETRSLVLRRMVEEFADKDKMEFMLVRENGTVATTTAGYVDDPQNIPRDYTAAQSGEDGVGRARYTAASGERVLAVTVMLPQQAKDISAVRFVTGVSLLRRQLLYEIALSACIVLAIMLFTVFSGVYFIRSIVVPVGEIEATANKIAKGDMGIRIDKQRYNDEIGSLANTINYMAGELEKTERMKNEFISSVSHELRTPLTSIKGWVETIGNIQDPGDPRFQRGVQIIAGETDRLYDMVEELLDFSRMQNGITLQLQKLDMVAEVSDVLLMMQPRADEKGVALSFIEPNRPAAVNADAKRLRQVLINVLDNALKYTEEGGGVEVDIQFDETTAYLHVADNGRGIAPDDLKNIKVKFYKGKNAVRGSGIGLAVADEIMRAHGGVLTVSSRLHEGTTVTLQMPLAGAGKPIPPAQKG